jgi:hypothetical protein
MPAFGPTRSEDTTLALKSAGTPDDRGLWIPAHLVVCDGHGRRDIVLCWEPLGLAGSVGLPWMPGGGMSNGEIDWITNFIWGIADDVLRDVYVRGKYRDVILPMLVLRRLDAVLERTKKPVIEMKARLDEAGVMNQDAALRQAARQAFYNISNFTLRDLRGRASQQQLKADFEAYLDGFSPNVQEILSSSTPRYIAIRRDPAGQRFEGDPLERHVSQVAGPWPCTPPPPWDPLGNQSALLPQ